MSVLTRAYGRLLGACAGLAALLLLAMVVGITADVVGRNALGRGLDGIDELSQYALALMIALTAPWLLHRGQHVRVELLLVALPARVAWALELVGTAAGLAIALAFAWAGFAAAADGLASGELVARTTIFPAWWLLMPLPVTMVLVAIELGFRVEHLVRGPRRPRHETGSGSW
jgi:TRAP-type C4-dicarboxylate transport system permease small subunit